jgi:hypothetical protein
MGGLNFFYEKQIEDSIKDADRTYGFTTASPNLKPLSDAPNEVGLASSAAAIKRDGANRAARRMQQKLGKKDE